MSTYARTRRRRGDYFIWRALSIFAAFGCLLVYSTLKGASELESFRASSSSPSHNHHLLVRREAEGNITEGIGEEEVKNCSEPAYQEFPSDGFTNAQRSGGAIVIHVLISLYMFLGLAIICDDYFVASLEQIVEKLQLSDDVAGATFMAAGSSAPELFTSIIGVFVAKGDVGIGTIVGSAVFNILVIIGLCALLCDKPTQLSWWPLLRDSSYYLVSIGILIVTMLDSEIHWWEAGIMLLFYLGYIVVMKFNTTLQAKVAKLGCCGKKDEKENVKMDAAQNGDVTTSLMQSGEPKRVTVSTQGPNGETVATVDEVAALKYSTTSQKGPDEMAAIGMRMMISNSFAPKTRLRMASRLLIMERKNLVTQRDTLNKLGEPERALMTKEPSRLSLQHDRRETQVSTQSAIYAESNQIADHVSEPDEDDDEESFVNPFQPPKGDFGSFMKWFISWPLLLCLFLTIPNCNNPRFEKFFILTFVMSTVWIAAFSYIMVWMVCLVGYTLGIPDTIMGITFLAAGTSVPDTIASVMVARNGYGDMAVSNSIGSNVFDILLGLGLPWFLSTTLRPNGAEATVHINSNGLMISVSLLLLSLIIVVSAIKLNGWKLDKRLGIIIMLSYVSFLILSILVETNVFFPVNLPTCIVN